MSAHTTPEMRRARAYGTKRYAMHQMRKVILEWTRARRESAAYPESLLREVQSSIDFGKVIGARSALHAVGAFAPGQYERACKRVERILHAKITRGLRLVKEAA